ncbi:MAG: hypothetical protein K0Q85_1455 [Caproiciproducens sp.]|jgi:hypothetical protein|nr:hypothetical protein [Caproiciproducens sp.]
MSETMVDYLAENCRLYISDLRLSSNSAVILPTVRELEEDLFSAEDWSASLSYIFQETLCFETSGDAKHYYIKKLITNLSHDDDNQDA